MGTEMTISISVFLQLASFVFALGGAYWLLINTGKKLDDHARNTRDELENILSKVENLSSETNRSFKELTKEQNEIKLSVGKIEASMKVEIGRIDQRFMYIEKELSNRGHHYPQ